MEIASFCLVALLSAATLFAFGYFLAYIKYGKK